MSCFTVICTDRKCLKEEHKPLVHRPLAPTARLIIIVIVIAVLIGGA